MNISDHAGAWIAELLSTHHTIMGTLIVIRKQSNLKNFFYKLAYSTRGVCFISTRLLGFWLLWSFSRERAERWACKSFTKNGDFATVACNKSAVFESFITWMIYAKHPYLSKMGQQFSRGRINTTKSTI